MLGTRKKIRQLQKNEIETKKSYKSQRQRSAWNRFVVNKWTRLKPQRNAFATFDNVDASTASQRTLDSSPFKCRIFLVFTFVASFCTTYCTLLQVPFYLCHPNHALDWCTRGLVISCASLSWSKLQYLQQGGCAKALYIPSFIIAPLGFRDKTHHF
jgi:hypothetical protein